jgi:hypothetical protein
MGKIRAARRLVAAGRGTIVLERRADEVDAVERWVSEALTPCKPSSASSSAPSFDQCISARWGWLQAYAQLGDRPRPASGSWIAACCLVRELPLATFNIKDHADFAEHEGLQLIH